MIIMSHLDQHQLLHGGQVGGVAGVLLGALGRNNIEPIRGECVLIIWTNQKK